MTPAPKRRWFRWSLRTLLLAVTIGAGLLYYAGLWVTAKRAEAHCHQVAVGYAAETVTTREMIEASCDALDAWLRLPLANHQAALTEHLTRLEKVKKFYDYLNGCPGTDSPAFQDELAMVDRSYAEAKARASRGW